MSAFEDGVVIFAVALDLGGQAVEAAGAVFGTGEGEIAYGAGDSAAGNRCTANLRCGRCRPEPDLDG
ncbi:hypothetical protein [Nocardia sp. NPDC058666]|uniref:hypothetical protein n=1 Tax=unclassified Nocardia TaxID=2637762 RepID=UPI00364BC0DB